VCRCLIVFLLLPIPAMAESVSAAGDHRHHGMTMDEAGSVMNENRDKLPRGCEKIEAEHEFTIYAGRDYADDSHGMTFGMSEHETRVEPCSRVTVTFVNEDEVRHQWMVHGLPKYLYPAGMFHIEAMGGFQKTGTFIVPGEDRNYLVHCDLAQHMEKGMRGQLVVGQGSGDLWSVYGVSDSFLRASYLPGNTPVMLIAAILAGLLGAIFVGRRM
jgi:plastocyanin